MAESYRGLTIRIGGDATELKKELKGANAAVAQVNQELRSLGKSVKLDPTNLNAYNMQMGYMANQAENVSTRLALLRETAASVGKETFDVNGQTKSLEELVKAADAYGGSIENVAAQTSIATSKWNQARSTIAEMDTDMSKLMKTAQGIEEVKIAGAFDLAAGEVSIKKVEEAFRKLPEDIRPSEERIKVLLDQVQSLSEKFEGVFNVETGEIDADAFKEILDWYNELENGFSFSDSSMKGMVTAAKSLAEQLRVVNGAYEQESEMLADLKREQGELNGAVDQYQQRIMRLGDEIAQRKSVRIVDVEQENAAIGELREQLLDLGVDMQKGFSSEPVIEETEQIAKAKQAVEDKRRAYKLAYDETMNQYADEKADLQTYINLMGTLSELREKQGRADEQSRLTTDKNEKAALEKERDDAIEAIEYIEDKEKRLEEMRKANSKKRGEAQAELAQAERDLHQKLLAAAEEEAAKFEAVDTSRLENAKQALTEIQSTIKQQRAAIREAERGDEDEDTIKQMKVDLAEMVEARKQANAEIKAAEQQLIDDVGQMQANSRAARLQAQTKYTQEQLALIQEIAEAENRLYDAQHEFDDSDIATREAQITELQQLIAEKQAKLNDSFSDTGDVVKGINSRVADMSKELSRTGKNAGKLREDMVAMLQSFAKEAGGITSEVFRFDNDNLDLSHIEAVLLSLGDSVGLTSDRVSEFVNKLGNVKQSFADADREIERLHAMEQFHDLLVAIEENESAVANFAEKINDIHLDPMLVKQMYELTTNMKELDTAYSALTGTASSLMSEFAANPENLRSLERAMSAFAAAETVAGEQAVLAQQKLDRFDASAIEAITDSSKSAAQQLYDAGVAATESQKRYDHLTGELNRVKTVLGELETKKKETVSTDADLAKRNKEIADSIKYYEERQKTLTKAQSDAAEESQRAADALEDARLRKAYDDAADGVAHWRAELLKAVEANVQAAQTVSLFDMFGDTDEAVERFAAQIKASMEKVDIFDGALDMDHDLFGGEVFDSAKLSTQLGSALDEAVSANASRIEKLREAVSQFDPSQLDALIAKYGSVAEAGKQAGDQQVKLNAQILEMRTKLAQALKGDAYDELREKILDLSIPIEEFSATDMTPPVRELREQLIATIAELQVFANESDLAAKGERWREYRAQLVDARAEMRELIRTATELNVTLSDVSEMEASAISEAFSGSLNAVNDYKSAVKGLIDRMTEYENLLKDDPDNERFKAERVRAYNEAVALSNQTLAKLLETTDGFATSEEHLNAMRKEFGSISAAVLELRERLTASGSDIELLIGQMQKFAATNGKDSEWIRQFLDADVAMDDLDEKMQKVRARLIELLNTQAADEQAFGIAIVLDQLESLGVTADQVGARVDSLRKKLSGEIKLDDSVSKKLDERLKDITEKTFDRAGVKEYEDGINLIDASLKNLTATAEKYAQMAKVDPSNLEYAQKATEAYNLVIAKTVDKLELAQRALREFDTSNIDEVAIATGTVGERARKAQDEYDKLSKKIKDTQDAIQQAKQDKALIDENDVEGIAKAEEKIAGLESKLTRFQEAASLALNELESELNTQALVDARVRVDELKASITKLTDTRDKVGVKVKVELDDTASKKFEQDIKAITDKGFKDTGVDDLLTRMDVLDESAKRSSEHFENMKKLLKEMPKDGEALEDTLEASKEYASILEQELKVARQALADFDKATIDEDVLASGNASGMFDAAKQQSDELKKKVAELEKALKTAKDELGKLGSGADTSKAQAEVDRVEKELDEAKAAAAEATEALNTLGNTVTFENLERRVDELNARVRQVGSIEAKDLLSSSSNDNSAAFMQSVQQIGQLAEQAGRKIMDSANEIDAAYRNMRKTVEGTEEQFSELLDEALRFSETHAVTAETMLEMEALGGQIGVTADELAQFGEIASNLDIATDISADQIALQLGQVKNIMSDIETMDDLQRFSDALVRLGNNVAAQESSIMDIAQRIAAIGNVTSMTTPQILAWSSAIAETGQHSESAATSLVKTVTGIGEAVAGGGENLEQFAAIAKMSADEFEKAWKTSSSDALQAFVAGLAELTDDSTEAIQALDSVGISSVRQETSLLALSQTFGNLEDNIRMATDAFNGVSDEFGQAGDAAIEAQKKSEGFSGQLQILKNAADQFGATLGESLVPFIKAAADVLNVLNDVLKSLPGPLQSVVVGVGGIAAAFGTAAPVVQQFIEGWEKMRGSSGSVIGSITGVNMSLGELIAKVAEFGTSFTGPFDLMKQAVKGAFDAISSGGKRVADAFVNLKAGASAMSAAFSAARGEGQSFGAALNTAIQQSVTAEGAFTGLATAVSVLKVALTGLAIGAVIAALGALVGHIADNVRKVHEFRKAQDDLKESSNRLREATNGATKAEKEFGDQVKKTAMTTEEATEFLQGLIDKRNELADKFEDQNLEIQVKSAMVDEAVAKIEELAEKGSELDAMEQADLTIAVETLNHELGLSLEVTDAAAGKIRDLGKDAEVTAGQIAEMANTEMVSEKEAALLEQKHDLLLEQQKEEKKLAELKANVSDAEDEVGKSAENTANTYWENYMPSLKTSVVANEQFSGSLTSMQGNFTRTSSTITEAEQAVKDYDEQIADVEGQLRELGSTSQKASDEMVSALAKVMSSSGDLKDILADLDMLDGFSFDDLAYQFVSLGGTTEDFASLTAVQLATIMRAYDGTSASIASALSGLGITLTKASEEAKKGVETVTKVTDEQYDHIKDLYDDLYTQQKRIRDDYYTSEKRALDDSYNAHKQYLDQRYTEYKNELDAQYEAEKRARDDAYEAAKDAYDKEYEAAKRARDDEYNAAKAAFDKIVDARKAELDAEYNEVKSTLDAIYNERKRELDHQYDTVKKSYSKAYDARKKELDKEYKAMKSASDAYLKAYKKNLDEQVDAFKKATDARLKDLERERDAKQEMLDEEYEGYDSDIQSRIDAINAEQEAEDEALEKAEQDAKLAELQKAIDTAKTDRKRREAENEYQEYVNELERKRVKKARQATIEQLKEQQAALKKQKQARDEELDDSYDNAVSSYKAAREAELKMLQEANEVAYDQAKELEDAKLEMRKEANDAELDQLKEQQDAELDVLKEQNDAALKELKAEHDTILDGIKANNDAIVDDLKADHEAQLLALKRTHEDELGMIKSDHEASLLMLKRSHEDQLTAIKQEQEANLEMRKSANDAELEALKRSNEDQLTMLKRAHEDELDAIKDGYDTTLKNLKNGTLSYKDALAQIVGDTANAMGDIAEKATGPVIQGVASNIEDAVGKVGSALSTVFDDVKSIGAAQAKAAAQEMAAKVAEGLNESKHLLDPAADATAMEFLSRLVDDPNSLYDQSTGAVIAKLGIGINNKLDTFMGGKLLTAKMFSDVISEAENRSEATASAVTSRIDSGVAASSQNMQGGKTILSKYGADIRSDSDGMLRSAGSAMISNADSGAVEGSKNAQGAKAYLAESAAQIRDDPDGTVKAAGATIPDSADKGILDTVGSVVGGFLIRKAEAAEIADDSDGTIGNAAKGIVTQTDAGISNAVKDTDLSGADAVKSKYASLLSKDDGNYLDVAGQNMVIRTSNAIAKNADATKGGASAVMSEFYSTVSKDEGSWASVSGNNMVVNFANGIYGAIDTVASAASAVASAAAAYLHHSTPDKGPLRDDDKWGAELVENIIRGVASMQGDLERQMRELSDSVAGGFNPAMPAVDASVLMYGMDDTTELEKYLHRREELMESHTKRMRDLELDYQSGHIDEYEYKSQVAELERYYRKMEEELQGELQGTTLGIPDKDEARERLKELEDVVEDRMSRMRDVMLMSAQDLTRPMESAYDAIDRISKGKYRYDASVAANQTQSYDNRTFSINISMPQMVVREEADIDRISNEIALKVQRELASRIG